MDASADATEASATSAPTDAGPAANPPDPTTDIAPAITLLDTTSPLAAAIDVGNPALPGSDRATSSLVLGPGLGAGPLPLPGPVVRPPLPGFGVPWPPIGIPSGPGGLTGPDIASPSPRPAPTPVTSEQASITIPTTPEQQAQAKVPDWLKKVLSPAVFLAWLLELLPLLLRALLAGLAALLRALLAGLAALLSAPALPPGGVVWRLPPELTHQLGGIGQANLEPPTPDLMSALKAGAISESRRSENSVTACSFVN